MSRRFRYEDNEILGMAYESDRVDRYHRPDRGVPSQETIQTEVLVDIRNLLYNLNESFAKIAGPIVVAQDTALEKPTSTFNPKRQT